MSAEKVDQNLICSGIFRVTFLKLNQIQEPVFLKCAFCTSDDLRYTANV